MASLISTSVARTVGQHKIIECLELKPISNFTVILLTNLPPTTALCSWANNLSNSCLKA